MRGGLHMEREQMRGKVCVSIDGDVIHRYAWFNERFERLPDSTAEKEILSVIENDTESLERACDVIDDLASLDNGLEFGSIPPQQVNKVVNAALDNVNEVLKYDTVLGCLLYNSVAKALNEFDDGTAMFFVETMNRIRTAMHEPLMLISNLNRLLHMAVEIGDPQRWFEECVLCEEMLFNVCYTSQFINYDLIDGSTKLDLYYIFDDIASYYTFMLLRFAQENKRINWCKCCGYYFVPKTKRRTLYCDRVFTEDGKTCKEVAPKLMQKLRRKKDVLLDEYDRVHNKNYKRFERGSWKLDGQQTEKDLSYEEYAEWADEARAARAAYIRGELGKDEFRKIIERLG